MMKQLLFVLLLSAPAYACAMDNVASIGANSGGAETTDMTSSSGSGSYAVEDTTSNNYDLHVSASDAQTWADNGSQSGCGDSCWGSYDH